MAEKTEVNYDQLQGFIKAFDSEAEEIMTLNKQLNSRVDDLHGGGWVGRGSDKFFDEMQNLVLPAVQRLAEALRMASQVTREIAEIYHQGEEETQGFFNSVGN